MSRDRQRNVSHDKTVHACLHSDEGSLLMEPLLDASNASTMTENEAMAPASPSSPPHMSSLRRRVLTGHDDSQERSFRILDRDSTFHQSRGRWSVQRLSRGVRLRRSQENRIQIWRIWEDWFHSLAYKPTFILMGILFLMYTLTVFFFAFVYLAVSILGARAIVSKDGSIKDSFCGMDINNHMEALYFSLSTMTTIGYGVSDYYFGDCWTPLLLVLWQACAAISFNAVAIGLLFQRISRGQKRGKSILFSDKAVIRRVRGEPYFMFRVGELRRHHLIETSVRAYCLRHERLPVHTSLSATTNGIVDGDVRDIETTHFLTRHMRILHPDEAMGSHILMSLPQVIVHRIDVSSPLFPPQPVWYDETGRDHKPRVSSLTNDAGSLNSIEGDDDDMIAFLHDREAEIVVLVEGTDELTGCALQARQSYRLSDIEWDHTFAPCVFPTRSTGIEERHPMWWWFDRRNCHRGTFQSTCTIDFSKFHDIVPAPRDCDACPYVP